MDLKNFNKIYKKIKEFSAKLLPVVKNRSVDEIRFLYEFGITDFGENRIEDYEKHKNSYNDVNYHFLAPLQSRKIKYISENFQVIHSVQRKKEVDLLNKQQSKSNIFLQINLDKDLNKSGIYKEELFDLYDYCLKKSIQPVGLMTIPNINSDPKLVFSQLSQLNTILKKDNANYPGELSMGMSKDYEIALEYGATIVRIGTKLFK